VIILGIDPGTARCGFGVIEKKGNSLKAQTFGVVEADREHSQPERLEIMYVEISRLIKKYKPDIMAVEKLFFSKNVKTAMSVGEARGVILLCGQLAGVEIDEYTPMQIKTALTGYGAAEKKQVAQMVKLLLGLKEAPKQDDAADALAAACCCASCFKMSRISKNVAGRRE